VEKGRCGGPPPEKKKPRPPRGDLKGGAATPPPPPRLFRISKYVDLDMQQLLRGLRVLVLFDLQRSSEHSVSGKGHLRV